ncbi:MAG: N-acetylmuramoyl-L-alanine amidase [Pyrinomonadaceae bacterium]|jgi:N-acetylmuramoyl-L-alanine amidase|nr:N-acetylmuramoyl-L-alanine amidase [Pyrinomonadaceae bacterium]
MSKTGTIVIDPGHGGTATVGGSSPNNARSPSGVLEKNLALQMAFLVRDTLVEAATNEGHTIKSLLTRETDRNLGLRDRALVARNNNADLFLCIHFNASNAHNARGVETLISPRAGNSNHAADRAFAQLIQTATLNALRAHDPLTRDREVKDQSLAVLRESNLGTRARGCLVEIEFLDHRAVDQLFNLGANAPQVRADVARAIANALVEAL